MTTPGAWRATRRSVSAFPGVRSRAGLLGPAPTVVAGVPRVVRDTSLRRGKLQDARHVGLGVGVAGRVGVLDLGIVGEGVVADEGNVPLRVALRLVRTLLVTVGDELANDMSEVHFPTNDEVVEALGLQCLHSSLRVRIHVGLARPDPDDLNVPASNTLRNDLRGAPRQRLCWVTERRPQPIRCCDRSSSSGQPRAPGIADPRTGTFSLSHYVTVNAQLVGVHPVLIRNFGCGWSSSRSMVAIQSNR